MKVNFEMRTIELTAKEMKQASTPHTCEYKELLSVMRDLPHFEIMVSRPHITNNANRGLTYAAMEQHITMNAAEKLDEFHTIQKLGGYPGVTKWFRTMFPEYSRQKAVYDSFAITA